MCYIAFPLFAFLPNVLYHCKKGKVVLTQFAISSYLSAHALLNTVDSPTACFRFQTVSNHVEKGMKLRLAK